MARRLPFLIPGSIVVLAVVFVGALWALGRSDDTIADGVRIGDVAVGGLTPGEARERVSTQIVTPARQPVVVRLRDRTFTLKGSEAGVRADVDAAVATAQRAGDGNALGRGWRKLTGGEVSSAIGLRVVAQRSAVDGFVSSIAEQVGQRPTDATLQLSVRSVDVRSGHEGRGIKEPTKLKERVMVALTRPGAKRTLTARLRTLSPKVDRDDVFERTPIQVTVSRTGRTVRVFKKGKLDKTYGVAVGSAQYPTPEGSFVVQTKQKNPVWSVPQSAWAGDLAGQVIPGGDARNPLKERWIGFNGSVGFHGSGQTGGGAQSHGCVRMVPSDVIDLFKRVQTGTPVLVGA